MKQITTTGHGVKLQIVIKIENKNQAYEGHLIERPPKPKVSASLSCSPLWTMYIFFMLHLCYWSAAGWITQSYFLRGAGLSSIICLVILSGFIERLSMV